MLHGKLVGTVNKSDGHHRRSAGHDHHGQDARRGDRGELAELHSGDRPSPPRLKRGKIPGARGTALGRPRGVPGTRRIGPGAAAGVAWTLALLRRPCSDGDRPRRGQQRGPEGGALVGRHGCDLDLEDVGEDLPPQVAGQPATGGAHLVGRATPAPSISSSPSRRPNATPSSTERARCGRSWPTVSPTKAPRARGSGCGLRSPVRYGRKRSPSLPTATVAASASMVAKSIPGASASRNQRRLPAAESITDMRCHRSGTAWQKAWTRPAGSTTGSAAAAKTTPGGSQRQRHDPRVHGAHADSVGRLVASAGDDRGPRPQACEARRLGLTCPETSGPSRVRGSMAGSRSRASRISSDQSRAARSSSRVPAASARSMARSPVSRRRT